jgi:hypothetical protein
VPEIKKNVFSEEIIKLEDPKLESLSSKKNVCFVVIHEDEDEKLVAKTVKDTLLLNKGIAKKVNFEPLIIAELYQHVWLEKMMPFTLDQWKFENA